MEWCLTRLSEIPFMGACPLSLEYGVNSIPCPAVLGNDFEGQREGRKLLSAGGSVTFQLPVLFLFLKKSQFLDFLS